MSSEMEEPIGTCTIPEEGNSVPGLCRVVYVSISHHLTIALDYASLHYIPTQAQVGL